MMPKAKVYYRLHQLRGGLWVVQTVAGLAGQYTLHEAHVEAKRRNEEYEAKKPIWAEVVHNILQLKNFTLDHLAATSCVQDAKTECEMILFELERDGYVEFLGDMYHWS